MMNQKYGLSLGLSGNVICPVYIRGIDHKGNIRTARYMTTDMKDAEIAADRFYRKRKEELKGVKIGVATFHDDKPGVFVHICGEEVPDFFRKYPIKYIKLPNL